MGNERERESGSLQGVLDNHELLHIDHFPGLQWYRNILSIRLACPPRPYEWSLMEELSLSSSQCPVQAPPCWWWGGGSCSSLPLVGYMLFSHILFCQSLGLSLPSFLWDVQLLDFQEAAVQNKSTKFWGGLMGCWRGHIETKDGSSPYPEEGPNGAFLPCSTN